MAGVEGGAGAEIQQLLCMVWYFVDDLRKRPLPRSRKGLHSAPQAEYQSCLITDEIKITDKSFLVLDVLDNHGKI